MGLFRKKQASAALPDTYAAVAQDDRQVLAQMVGLGADLSQPRHVLHYLYVATQEAADAASTTATDAGWEAEAQPSAAGDGTWCVLAQRHGYVLAPDAVIADRALFAGLATTHAGEYDGWEASVT
jgi:hypothetical protein